MQIIYNELLVECYFITSGKTLREALLLTEEKGHRLWSRQHIISTLEGRKGRCTLHMLGIHGHDLKSHFWEVSEEPVLVLLSVRERGIPSTQCLSHPQV